MEAMSIHQDGNTITFHNGRDVIKYRTKIDNLPFEMLAGAVRNALMGFCEPVTLQYQNGFHHIIIQHAHDLGFDAEPHATDDGWWRCRPRGSSVSWYNAPLDDLLKFMERPNVKS